MPIVRKSLSELSEPNEKLLKRLQYKTDNDDIDFSDIPELDEEFWKKAKVQFPDTKASVHIRLDRDVLEWLKGQGKGYQTRINAILRSYYEAHQEDTPHAKR